MIEKPLDQRKWYEYVYFKWYPVVCGRDDCVDSRYGVFLYPGSYLSASVIQLVKRAQYNQGECFGLPIEALFRRARSPDGWDISTEAVFTPGNSLLLKVTSTIRLRALTEPVNVQLCACCDKKTLQAHERGYREVIDAQFMEHYDRLGEFRTRTPIWYDDRNWYQCRSCLAAVTVSFGIRRTRVGDTNPATRLQGRMIEVTRYHDLGPVCCMNYGTGALRDPETASRLYTHDYRSSLENGFRHLGIGQVFERFSRGNAQAETGRCMHEARRFFGGANLDDDMGTYDPSASEWHTPLPKRPRREETAQYLVLLLTLIVTLNMIWVRYG